MSRADERRASMEKQIEKLKKGKFRSSESNLYEDMVKRTEKPIINVDINSLFPAPEEWNFFPTLSEGKMLEMMFSILENGLFNPIILWKQDNGYMILSGHNRVKAYKNILEEYKDTPNFDVDKYKTIPSIVYEKDEIDEYKAKEIIIDTNYIQREDTKKLMPQIVKNRLEIVRNRKDTKGRTIDIVAQELGISSTKVYEDQLIANRIISEFNDLYFNEKLKKKALLRFAWFDKETQKWIYENFKDYINSDSVMKIKKNMNKEEIKNCLIESQYEEKEVNVSMKVPESLVEEFREMATKWLLKKNLKG